MRILLIAAAATVMLIFIGVTATLILMRLRTQSISTVVATPTPSLIQTITVLTQVPPNTPVPTAAIAPTPIPPIPTLTPTATPTPFAPSKFLDEPWLPGRRGDDTKNLWQERTPTLAVDADGLTIYTSGGGIVCRSTDDGETWWAGKSCTAIQGSCVGNIRQLAASPKESKTIYALDDGGRIWQSTDGGDIWNLIEAPPGTRTIAISSGYLYAGGYSLFRSADKGNTWREISKQIGFINLILPVPHFPSYLYAYTAGGSSQGGPNPGRFKEGLYFSKDGGFPWVPIPDSNSSWRVTAFAVDSLDPPNIYVATAVNGLLNTNALDPLNPENWKTIIQLPEGGVSLPEAGTIYSLAIHPLNPRILVVADPASRLFVTFNGGESWIPLHHAGHIIGNVIYGGLPLLNTSPRPVAVTSGPNGVICIGSGMGVWCHTIES